MNPSLPDAGAVALIESWLSRFQRAREQGDPATLQGLFSDECHWRDALALTWSIDTYAGKARIAPLLAERLRATGAGVLRIDATRTPPRRVMRAGEPVIEALLAFDTGIGVCSGVLRLRESGDAGTAQAWTLFTALESLHGFEERIGARRPTGQSHSRDFHGPNWLDKRRAAATYADREPAVVVVGGGQAGLAIAARLTVLGVDTLIVEREARIGDNWRNRYHALTLHNQVQVNHLPYIPFPPNWPVYIPKDKLAGWFEAYAQSMELNVWNGTEVINGEYDDGAGHWRLTVRRNDGSTRELRPRHVVMATGVSGIPNRPDIPTLGRFKGTVVHSEGYQDGEAWTGKSALVIGSGNSAHDISQDLHGSGAQVTMVQRSPTLVVSIEPSGQMAYTLYDEGPPLEDCDLIASGTPQAVGRRAHQLITARTREIDGALHDGLRRVGFELDFGDDDTGWQYKYLTRGGGYYFNVGCSELLIQGKVKLRQFRDIESFESDGVRFRDGAHLPLDLVVLATGYKGQEALVEKLFGADVARRIGPIWGFGNGAELRNMYVRTAQPGLWFIAGSLAQCRINSKYLALQIKACEQGLIEAAMAPGTYAY